MIRSRRQFLKSTLASPALLSLTSAAPARPAHAAAEKQRGDTVLVIVQLSGGNDGLNTVAPYADDAYARSRSTLRLTGKDVHKIDDYVGFHPKMEGFARLLKAGRLSVVQGVGYPKSDRSHPGAMRDWHTARPARDRCPTGWLGRAVDSACRQDEARVPGVFVGPIVRPFALTAEKACVPSIRSARELTLHAMPESSGVSPQRGRSGEGNPLADYVQRSSRSAYEVSRRIQEVLADAPAAHRYPPLRLAGHLKTVAQLIRADVGIRIFLTELGGGGIGGFDNHANQRDNHAAILGQLSDSVAAFADDLARHKSLDRVCLMTFSEFGRTLSENGRRGTGHGAAAPVFLMGGRVRPGLIGKHPSLVDLDNDAPRFHTDFRRLYATVLDNWLGFDSDAVLGEKFDPFDIFVA